MSKALAPSATIYARISQDRTGAGLGVDRQIADCRELAERFGLEVVAVHTDNDVSAYAGKPRPGYAALVEEIKSGRITVVLAWHVDRLHRSTSELESYIKACEQHTVATQTVQSGLLDLSTPAGRMTAKIIGAVAQQESEHKGERIRAARRQRVLAGRFPGGTRPFGFEADGVTVRPSEAAEIVKATDALLAGAGLRSVAMDLNRRSVPTSLGAEAWTSRTIKDVLCRPRNAGLNVYREEIVGPAIWEAIVPEPKWRALVTLLKDPARRTSPSDVSGVRWLGSGLYRCGVCGRAELRVSTSSHGYPVYRCRARDLPTGASGHVSRKAADLDAYVQAVIVERLQRPDAVELIRPVPDVDMDALRATAVELTERLDQLAEAHADGHITLSQLTRGSERMHGRLAEIQREIAAAVHADPLAELVGDPNIESVWRRLDLGLQRAVLGTLMVVTVHPSSSRRGPDGTRFDRSSIEIAWKGGA